MPNPIVTRRPAVPFILVTIFLDVLGFGLIIPVLPGLIGEFTSASDAQAYWYGALAAAYGLMQFCCAPLLGAMSDRFGRRPVLLLSIFGLGCDFLLMALAPNLWVLLLARLLGGATGASFSVANAYIADVTSHEARGRGFGALGAAFGLGFIFGPMLGGLLGTQDLRLPFYVAAGLSLLNALYGLLVLPESHPRDRRVPFEFRRANPLSALVALAQLRGVGSLIAVYTLFMLAQFVLHTTWVLYNTFRFGWGPSENGLSLFIVGLVGAVVQGALLSRLLRWGERQVVYAGFASATVAYVAYGLATEGWMMYCIIFANLLSFAATPALQAIISKEVPPQQQGVAMGSLNSISSLMLVVAPVLSTPLLAHVSHYPRTDWRIGATFFLSAALQGSTLLLAWLHFRRRPVAPAGGPTA
ncbi:TCR/Tet family MFS transporter [Chitiniphilus purpureus]|uniref:TCR/Tet family MFS transporter n=1 Tax=Chitiniphilus purpureus TaxID=2981137 RepID=A0ABY6DL87_9NEIS|nr:TCR/Tet family MFS transporter [Chitiniphilus sp. CD1]UXY14468.1 TCR/Tet family MFS transporter [Chitiniphilus sp. CD1]